MKLNPSWNVLWRYQTLDTTGSISFSGTVSLALDDNYMVYLATSFETQINVGPYNITSRGGSDIAIIKLTAAGVFSTSYAFGGSLDDTVVAMFRVPGSTELILTGTFAGFVTSQGGSALFSSSGYTDMYALRITSDLQNIRASKAFGGPDSDVVFDAAVDSTGLYLVGYFYSTVTYKSQVTSKGVNDIVLLKLSLIDFSVIWQYVAGGGSQDEGHSIAVDEANDLVYISGIFTSTVDFGPTTHSIGTDYNFFLVQVNSLSGLPVWALQGGSFVTTDYGRALTVDNLGNVYLAGVGGAPMTFGQYNKPSGTDFIAKVNRLGTVLWLTGSNNAQINPRSLFHMGNGNVLLIGSSSSLSGMFGNFSVAAFGESDLFMARVDTLCVGCPTGIKYSIL